ncbi:hypothetical protein AGMMS50212_05850 [Spirochaetia bacterium]|nr:hypothetical protein AGMMS50212_05850 [Spirochaetia bacterium]
MHNWRDSILEQFIPQVSRLTLVADPDNLLTEEKLVTELRQRGFDIIEFSDSIEFRFAYESKYRAIWDKGEYTDLVVILRLQNSELDSLPFDLLSAGRKLKFILADIFPHLNYRIISELDKRYLDALYEAQINNPPDKVLGENATNLFIQKAIFPTELELKHKAAWEFYLKLHEDTKKIVTLFEIVESAIPTIDARHSDWIDFAIKLAELSSLVYRTDNRTSLPHLNEISANVNTVFSQWLILHYASLLTLPPTTPAMLHHIPRYLARNRTANTPIALIVLDGLALDQWKTIESLLVKKNTDLQIQENAVFAWIPTLTSVSRQAIFSGKQPIYFASSIDTTDKEESLWKNFWDNEQLAPNNIVYRRNLKNENAKDIFDTIIKPNSDIVGLVVNMVDDIMHGMQLGSSGMHNQITGWCNGGFLNSLVTGLLERKYEVYLTADHGNIECKGIGRIAEGVIADTKGERVRIYCSEDLRARTSQMVPSAYSWQQIGLPADYFPLIANERNAFVTKDESIVTHGGISVEEVIVPFIKIEKVKRSNT